MLANVSHLPEHIEHLHLAAVTLSTSPLRSSRVWVMAAVAVSVQLPVTVE